MKIAICIPCHGDPKAQFTLSLSRLLIRTARAKFTDENGRDAAPEIEVFMAGGSALHRVRTGLVENALDWGADYLVLVDADHTFPADALLRLLSLGNPVVACNYQSRGEGRPVASSGGAPLESTPEKIRAAMVEEAATCGLGFCLVRADAVKAINGPLFVFATEDNQPTGEDVWFFNRLREAGHPLFIDHGLSGSIGHITQTVLSFAS